MICLHCGDCCTRFEISEINKEAGHRCQYLTVDNLCSIYDRRPDVCYKHNYPSRICPIGAQKRPEEYERIKALLIEKFGE